MTNPPGNFLQKPSYSITSSNYADYSSLESLNTARVSVGTNFGGTFSADCGVDTKFTENGISSTPAIELKYKQKFGELSVFDKPVTLGGYIRYRDIMDEYQQLRFSADASMAFDDKWSLYAAMHYTTKLNEDNQKAGGWVGVGYKIDKHWSVWAEQQLNVALDGSGACSPSTNFGVTYKF